MALKCLFLVIVLVNFCSGQYPNIVPGLNGGLDPSLIGLPAQFPGFNGGLDPSFIGNPSLLPGLNGGINPSFIGNPPQISGQPHINTDYETDESDVMTYFGKGRGNGRNFNEADHYPACDKFCGQAQFQIRECCKNKLPNPGARLQAECSPKTNKVYCVLYR